MRVIIAHNDAYQREHLRQVALSLGLTCEAVDCTPLNDLRVRFGQVHADVVLVGLGEQPAAAFSVIEQAVSYVKGPILAVGPSNDPQIIRHAIRSGAREYLDEANARAEFLDALNKLAQAGVVNFRRGTTISVIAPMPGTGVSTVACGLAFSLGEKYPRQVALAELGGGVPALALALDLQPQHGVDELTSNWDRLDATMLEQALVAHPAGVSVLAHVPETLHVRPLSVEALQQSLLLLKAMFEFVVVDLGHYADSSALQAMALSDKILVVVRLDVPCLRLARRFLQELATYGVNANKIQIIANRYGQRKQITWKQAEQTLGMSITDAVPDDAPTLNEATNQGQPLVKTARRAGITRTFDKLATTLNGRS